MFRMQTQLKLTGFLESSPSEPSLLLQIQWKDNHLGLDQFTWPDLIPVYQPSAVYSSLHRIPYHSLSTLPPSELDLSNYFSAAEYASQCSLYLAPKIASFVSDIASSFGGDSPPSLFVFAELKTLNMNFFYVPRFPCPVYPPTEPLMPLRQDPYHQPQGAPLIFRAFCNNTLSPLLMEEMEENLMGGGYSTERNRSRARGASLQAIARLKEPMLVGKDSEAGDCSVCLQEMSGMKELLAMPCDHIFHKKCILSWLENKKTCPLCRSKLQD